MPLKRPYPSYYSTKVKSSMSGNHKSNHSVSSHSVTTQWPITRKSSTWAAQWMCRVFTCVINFWTVHFPLKLKLKCFATQETWTMNVWSVPTDEWPFQHHLLTDEHPFQHHFLITTLLAKRPLSWETWKGKVQSPPLTFQTIFCIQLYLLVELYYMAYLNNRCSESFPLMNVHHKIISWVQIFWHKEHCILGDLDNK